jgi:hypothetical protein
MKDYSHNVEKERGESMARRKSAHLLIRARPTHRDRNNDEKDSVGMGKYVSIDGQCGSHGDDVETESLQGIIRSVGGCEGRRISSHDWLTVISPVKLGASVE